MIKNLSNMKNYNHKRERCCEYIEALEEERRKINVFQRELPLCVELVTKGINLCIQHTYALTFHLGYYEIYIYGLMLDLKILNIYILAIETYKREMSGITTDNLYGQSECSEQTTGECGRVLDLFIPPIKHSSTSVEEFDDKDDHDDDDEHESHETDIDFNDKNMKSDWLKSVQLWNQSDTVVSNRQVIFQLWFYS